MFFIETLYTLLAKPSSISYDGRVRKVSVFVLSILILSVLGYFSLPKAYAASLPPCTQWVYFYDDPKGRCLNKADIPKLDETKDENNCRLNGQLISTNDLKNVDPKNIKCATINTAIGEISTEPQGFVKRIFSLVLGLAGGIALILIILSGYRFMASQGNPEALTNARQQLISAIVGLLFIIFSFVILEVIGVDILRIPGFGE